MDLDELRSVRRTERQKDSLQHLRDSFYEDVAAYIADLKAERERVAAEADDPFSAPEVGRLTDEIETAEDIVEAVYERRVGKVVKLASFAAADMPTDTDGLTSEEQSLFDDLVGRIKGNRQTVLDTLAGKHVPTDDGSDGATEDPSPSSPATADAGPPERAGEPSPDDAPAAADVFADAMGGGESDSRGGSESDVTSTETPTAGSDDAASPTPEAPPDRPASADGAAVVGDAGPPTTPDDGAGASGPDEAAQAAATAAATGDDTERVTLRITEDVGPILGVDEREYDLASEDVVTLPTTNAEPLLQRDAAERLD